MFKSVECVLCLIILFFCNIRILFVLMMVDSWCVIMRVVWFVEIFLRVFWMFCFVFVLSVEVVLLRIRMGGFFKIVCVMVICCFLLFESFNLCLFIWEWYLLGKFEMKLWIWVRCVDVLMVDGFVEGLV